MRLAQSAVILLFAYDIHSNLWLRGAIAALGAAVSWFSLNERPKKSCESC